MAIESFPDVQKPKSDESRPAEENEKNPLEADAQFLMPEDLAKMRQEADKKADDALLQKISKGGVLDSANPAEVAAAARIIQRETGKKVRLADEVSTDEMSQDVNIQEEVTNERLRAKAVEIEQIVNTPPRQTINTTIPLEELVRANELQQEFEKNPGALLSRRRKILLTLDAQYDTKPELYEVVNREGENVTLSRVDRLGPDGKELPDPKDWKVLVRTVNLADIVAKKARIV